VSAFLRSILFFASTLTFVYTVRQLRKAQLQVADTVFWVCITVIFVLLSIFPQVASWISRKLGFQAPVNFIFLVMLFCLLAKVFLLSIRVSQLDDKLRNLTEEIAIRENMKE